ncbi:MAG: OmpA family protein [Saprospiraceae bacterium]|nr:OmpA family protein [Saprospiraceae bacterium]
MKKLIFTLALAWVMMQIPAMAQYDGAPDGITVRYTLTNYHYPIIKEDPFYKQYNEPGLELGYVRNLNNFLNLAIPIKFGSANLPVTETSFDNRQFVGNLDALLQIKYFKEPNWFSPYLFAGLGANYEFTREHFNLQIPVGVGLNIRLAPHFYLNGQASYRVGTEDLKDNLQHGIGFMYLIGPYEPKDEIMEVENPDRDGDGIVDADDECPDEPGVAALNGCPDSDGDGIADKMDACPTVAGTAATNGCPDGDGDGIRDSEDRCPNAAGSPGLNGCPDKDGDGVADPDDECPDKAGLAMYAGCPDTDKDGVSDNKDKCPDKAGPASNSGCPELKQEEKAVLAFAMQAVEFETAKAVLLPDSKEILNQIADILKNYPEYHLKIEGHTDSVGDEKTNLDLSQKRAASCKTYLVSRGISTDRIATEGFGESRPIGDNRYKDGRQKNRRVEFKIFLP